MLVNIEHVYKYFGGEPLLKDINLTIENHETIGLIGVNGCGKSTLLNITGREGFDRTPEGDGAVNISSGAVIGFLRQNSGLDSDSTIDEELHKAFSELLNVQKRMKKLEERMTTLTGNDLEMVSGEYAELSSYFESRDGYRIDVKIRFSTVWGSAKLLLTELSQRCRAEKKHVLHWQNCCWKNPTCLFLTSRLTTLISPPLCGWRITSKAIKVLSS